MNRATLASLVFVPTIAFAHAGMVDRHISMAYDLVTTAYVVTLTYAVLWLIDKHGYLKNKKMLSIARIVYSVCWIMVLISLFCYWPFFWSVLLAPIYLFPVVVCLNTYEMTNPKNWLGRLLINVGLTLLATIGLVVVIDVFAGVCECLCSWFIPNFMFYRRIRDGIYNMTSLDVNYVTILFVIHSLWICGRSLWQYHKRNGIAIGNTAQ